MSDLISKALFCGLGLASLTKDAIAKLVEDMVDQSKISQEEGRRLFKDLQRRSIQAQKALEKAADTSVHDVLEHLNLPAIIVERLTAAQRAHGRKTSNGRKPAKKPARKSPRRAAAAKVAKR